MEDNTTKLGKLAIDTPKGGSGDKHHNKEKPGPTMRKKSMKKKKMTDEEILAALSKYLDTRVILKRQTSYTQIGSSCEDVVPRRIIRVNLCFLAFRKSSELG